LSCPSRPGPSASAIVTLLFAWGCSSGGEDAQGHREERAAEAERAFWFVDEASSRGVHFTHVATRTAQKLLPEILGSGVALTDFDRDGDVDIYFVGGGDLSQGRARPAAAKDRLLLNDGRGNFLDATEEWGLTSSAYGMGAAVGDFDNDGWADLLLTTFGGGERLMRNTGRSFEDVGDSAGVAGLGQWSTGAGFFDCEGDGDLDIYVVRYIDYDIDNALKCWHNERHIYCSPALFEALPDTLLRNEGGGSFIDISEVLGTAARAGKGLALALGDVDWDGDVDVFVANDITRNLLFVNDGSGRFEERGQAGGVAYDETGRASAGMGADFTDIDGNGLQDISCTNFQDETTNIYMQKTPLVFRDRSYAVGVGRTAQERLSFGVDFCDLDNDGDEDLFVANGHMDDGIESVSESITFAQQNSIYRLGEGERFEDVSARSGPALELVEVTRGAASADLDGDGRMDLVLTTNAGPARLMMNRSESGQAVVLWLEGVASNRSAIGARVEARAGARTLRQEVRGASSYLSQCDLRLHFGLGPSAALSEARVLWPSGATQELGELAPGFYHVVEGQAPRPFVPGQAVIPPQSR
jgi:hypothetical protein